MQVIIESTNLKQKGFISFFKTKKFEITFYDKSCTEPLFKPLILKAKVAFVDFIVKLSNVDRFSVKIRVDEIVSEHEIFLKEGKVDIKVNNSKFRGTITFNITNESLYNQLENMHLVKKGFEPICGDFTTCTEQASEKIAIRQTYYQQTYFVDLLSQTTSWKKECVKNNEPLPKGWERKYTLNNKVYYVDHNKNTTQWDNPNSKAYITELENKILRYRLVSEERNLIQFFDFSKFRIIVNRKFMVESTASIFIRAKREHLLRQPFVVFCGEIGEDYGGLLKEFFYDASLEIAKDERIKCTGSVFDVYGKEETQPKRQTVNKNGENITNTNKECVNNNSNNNESNNVSENIADMFFQATEDPIAIDTNQIEGTIYQFVDRNGAVTEHLYITNSLDMQNLDMSDDWYCETNYGKNRLNDKDFFMYLGIFLGLALEHELNISMDFTLAFYENLLDQKFDISHIQDVEFQSNLLFILKNNVNELEMLNIDDEPLTEDNKHEYVKRNINYHLYESKKEKYDWIRKGFYRVAIKQVSSIFTANDLARIFAGKEDLTLEILQNSVLYLNCNENSKEVVQLWNILKRKDEQFYRKFLHFITGSASIPITGLKINKYKWFVELINEHDVFVRASTCLSKLFIGKYDTEDAFEEKLIFSIENTEGFHKV